jgi:carnitine-CoA ligase
MRSASSVFARRVRGSAKDRTVTGAHDRVCLVDVLRERQVARPDEVFFSCDGESLTYRELWHRAGALASALIHAGAQPGVVVAGLSYNCADTLCLMFACLRAGAIWAPLNVALGPDDLHYSAAAAQAKMLVVSREMARRNAAGLGALSATMPILQLEEMGEPDHPWLRMLRRDAAPSDHPAHSWSTREACWIIFSGATTGRPKAIVLPHSHGVACGQRSIEALDLGVGDAFYSVLQMCHGWLLFHIITPALLTGIPCAATRWFSASRWLADVRRLGATIVDPFLPMIGAIMAQPERADDGDNPARACIGALGSVSELARPRLDAFEKRFGLKTLNGYGSTELGGLTSRETLTVNRLGTSGRPHPHYEFRIADEAGWPALAGTQGEILIRPRTPGTVALGYLGNAEGTLQAWRDLWVHTSDIGYFDEDGFLNFVGRHAHWIRRKSENVSIKEVEDALLMIAGVSDAGVIGIRAEMGDEEAAAFVVVDDDTLTLEKIRDNLAQRLAYFKIPRFYERVSELPKTVKGEVSRRHLKERGLSPGAWDAGSVSSPAKAQ